MTIRFIKSVLIISILTLSLLPVNAQEPVKVRWYTIEEAEKLAMTNPKPIFIDTYTDWCSWCKRLDTETFANPVIAEILNTKFYPVKFNAEGKDEITFRGMKFVNDGKYGRTHQLTIALLKEQIGYPSIIFFNEKIELLTVVPGFRTAKDMEPLISYFADKAYDKSTFDEYAATFKGSVK
jgi:thioredoxin-related protein